MPLKYIWGLAFAVKLVGWAHGVLFIAYVALIRSALREARWPLWRGLVLLAAALIPFGPFVIDRSLKVRQLANR
jgi:integral membrane protein